jgi:sugar fermentation stimulation protein A
VRLFSDTLEARFLERPNRFLVRALSPDGEVLTAHCPNPGRMREILLPGAALILERAANPKRKTAWTLAAARHRGRLIPLRSSQANQLAAELLLPRLYPDMISCAREVPWGRSRFDFLVRTPGKEIYLEVKACTLVEEKVAMFPDAPSARALRHLEELAALARPGRRGEILFVVMNPEAESFVPNIHTDPAFSRKLLEARGHVGIRAASIRVDGRGTATLANPDLKVDFRAAETNGGDRGAYLLIAPLSRDTAIAAGALGRLDLEQGWYVYVGSAMKNLEARLRRHRRSRKRPHWHIDALLAAPGCGPPVGLAVRSARRLECPLAADLAVLAPGRVNGFGSSDCGCRSHLFVWPEDPLASPAFLALLARYRHVEALRADPGTAALRRETGGSSVSPGSRNPGI